MPTSQNTARRVSSQRSRNVRISLPPLRAVRSDPSATHAALTPYITKAPRREEDDRLVTEVDELRRVRGCRAITTAASRRRRTARFTSWGAGLTSRATLNRSDDGCADEPRSDRDACCALELPPAAGVVHVLEGEQSLARSKPRARRGRSPPRARSVSKNAARRSKAAPQQEEEHERRTMASRTEALEQRADDPHADRSRGQRATAPSRRDRPCDTSSSTRRRGCPKCDTSITPRAATPPGAPAVRAPRAWHRRPADGPEKNGSGRGAAGDLPADPVGTAATRRLRAARRAVEHQGRAPPRMAGVDGAVDDQRRQQIWPTRAAGQQHHQRPSNTPRPPGTTGHADEDRRENAPRSHERHGARRE